MQVQELTLQVRVRDQVRDFCKREREKERESKRETNSCSKMADENEVKSPKVPLFDGSHKEFQLWWV